MHFRTAVRWQVLLIAGALLAGCGDDDDADFTATLSGANEVEPVDTDATGSFALTDEGDHFEFRLTVNDIVEPTAAHIHVGAAGVNGGIAVPLFSTNDPDATFSGTLAAGEFDAADIQVIGGATLTLDELRALFRTNGAYVNVHTSEHPGGEIRGQIVAN